MSAFMVSHTCISRVVMVYRAHNDDGHSGRPDPDLLGMMLIEMNRRAIRALYGTTPEVEPYRYIEPRDGTMTLVATYKALRCYLYQCSEGDIPETEPLFGVLVTIRDSMAKALGHVSDNQWRNAEIKSAYDAAEWG